MLWCAILAALIFDHVNLLKLHVEFDCILELKSSTSVRNQEQNMTSFRCLLQQPPTSLLQTRELESRRVLHVTTGEAEGLWQKKVANIGHVSDMIQKDFATTS